MPEGRLERTRQAYGTNLVVIRMTAAERDAYIRDVPEPEDEVIDVGKALTSWGEQWILKELDRK